MAENAELAAVLRNIADLLDVQGERFKPEAYRRASRSIEALPENIATVVARGGLDEIPGVGEAIAEKIREYLKTGKIAYHERLRHEVPPGIVEILQLPGLGPKTARRFWVELDIEGPQELAEAIRQGRLNGVKGFGPRKIELIRQTLEGARSRTTRTPIAEAFLVAEGIVRNLTASQAVERVAIAGSLRRCRETVGDLDVLVTSRTPKEVFDRFSALPEVAQVVMRGPTKETVLLSSGVQVDVRVVEPDSFGAALVYFTGSKDHNIHLRSLARDRGLKVNEYGVFRGDERVAGATEEDVYATFGLPWIPAEIREDRGELAAAEKGELPRLVEGNDLKGFLHHHLDRTTRPAQLTTVFRDARTRGHSYVGWVVSDGDPAALETMRRKVGRAAREAEFALDRVLLGVERAMIEGSTGKELPDGVDFWVVRPEGSAVTPPKDFPESGTGPLFVGHLELGTAAEEVPDSLRTEWVEWAQRHSCALEVTPAAARDGLDSAGVRRAVDAEVDLLVGPGVPPDGDVDLLPIAIGLARRGWATASHVLNAREVLGRRPPLAQRRRPSA